MIPTNKNLPWLHDRTILYTVTGSRAYGTHRPDSDYDYAGICIPPAQYRDGYLLRFDQAEFGKAKEPPASPEQQSPDATIYGIQKYFKLAADCNPNVIEVIWAPDDCIVRCTTHGRVLRNYRDLFLSQKARHTFRGYAMSQLNRIKTHRRWLLDPPKKKPERKDYGLPEFTAIPADQVNAAHAMIQKKIDSWEIDFGELAPSSVIYIQEQISHHLTDMQIGMHEKFFAAGRLLSFDDNFLSYLDSEKRYKAAKQEWKQYHEWKEKRNPARAALEASHGYDTKHAMHLVRLMRMCREILTEGEVLVRRPDAEDLKKVLTGPWTYDSLLAWAEEQDQELKELKSDLPREPDRKRLDRICRCFVTGTRDEWDDEYQDL